MTKSLHQCFHLPNPHLPLLFLAPMAGYTQAPMRRLCRQHGAALTYTEMTNDLGLLHASDKTWHLLETFEDEGPVVAHLYGSDPVSLSEAAARVEQTERFAGIDLNAGCPVHKITANGAGAVRGDFMDRTTGVEVDSGKAFGLFDPCGGLRQRHRIGAVEVGHDRSLVFKSFEQVPGFVGRVQQAEVIRHFGIGERGAVLPAQAAHRGLCVAGHRSEEQQGEVGIRKMETLMQRFRHDAQSIADFYWDSHAENAGDSRSRRG
jgi:hypothetical protein